MKVRLNSNKFRSDGRTLWSISEGWRDDSIALGVDYEVYGLGVYNGVTKILIDPESEFRPFWYSIDQFVIVDEGMQRPWVVSIKSGDWSMLMGYPMLVHSAEHFDGILERNAGDLATFRAAIEQSGF